MSFLNRGLLSREAPTKALAAQHVRSSGEKSEVVAQLAQREQLRDDEFASICQKARKKLEPERERRLPQLLTAEELNRLEKAVRDSG